MDCESPVAKIHRICFQVDLENWVEPVRALNDAERQRAFVLDNNIFSVHPLHGRLQPGSREQVATSAACLPGPAQTAACILEQQHCLTQEQAVMTAGCELAAEVDTCSPTVLARTRRIGIMHLSLL